MITGVFQFIGERPHNPQIARLLSKGVLECTDIGLIRDARALCDEIQRLRERKVSIDGQGSRGCIAGERQRCSYVDNEATLLPVTGS